MSITAILSGAVAIAKAIPAIRDIVNQFYNLWVDAQIDNARELRNETQHQRNAILESLKNAKTDEERIALSKLLHDFNRGKL